MATPAKSSRRDLSLLRIVFQKPSASRSRYEIAQYPSMNRWRQRHGPPARRIEALAQTRDGFLWMATRGGVVRFDGKSFRLYNYKNTANFTRDMAVSVAVGPHGLPWIGTDGGGCGPLRND